MANHIFFELPTMAFDMGIDVINATADCEDFMDCDLDIDALMDKYPKLEKDFDYLDFLAGPDPNVMA